MNNEHEWKTSIVSDRDVYAHARTFVAAKGFSGIIVIDMERYKLMVIIIKKSINFRGNGDDILFNSGIYVFE